MRAPFLFSTHFHAFPRLVASPVDGVWWPSITAAIGRKHRGKKLEQIKELPDQHKPRVLDEWMTRSELAADLDLSIDTLARWETRRNGPPCIRIGRKVLYRRAAVQEWLRQQEHLHARSSRRK
jgi:excisionase family DNA binding protein